MAQAGIGRPPRPFELARRIVACVVIFLAAASLQSAQEAPDNPEARGVRRMVQDASRALQAGNAASFLRLFDRKQFAGYPSLESHVVALTTQSDVASSIQIVEIVPVQDGYRLRVDWLLELSVQETPGPLETRREVLEISVGEEAKGRWKITSLRPVEFFRPQGAGQGTSR